MSAITIKKYGPWYVSRTKDTFQVQEIKSVKFLKISVLVFFVLINHELLNYYIILFELYFLPLQNSNFSPISLFPLFLFDYFQ